MSPVAFTGASLTAAISASNTLASSAWGTFTGNVGWYILVATAGLIIALLLGLKNHMFRLGRR
jgi:hypothetical protein